MTCHNITECAERRACQGNRCQALEPKLPMPDADWTPGATLCHSPEQMRAYAAAAVAAERERWRPAAEMARCAPPEADADQQRLAAWRTGMTTLREAAQAALDALEKNVLWHHDYDDYGGYAESDLAQENSAAVCALRAALAQPEHQGDRLQMLLRRSRVQLRKWAEWYGSADHAARGQLPLPPAGDVELAEDISDALAKTDAAPNLADPAVQKRLAAQWGYTKAEPQTQGDPDDAQ